MDRFEIRPECCVGSRTDRSEGETNGAVEEAETQRIPPSRPLALVAIASNTGCTSDGELAITFR